MQYKEKSPFTLLKNQNLKDISTQLLLPNGKLKLLPAKFYQELDQEELKLFCLNYARYGVPTTELIEFIIKEIDGRSVIEIGSGHGDLGYHLNIKMTDSKIQNIPEIKEFYKSIKQPTINYPEDVEEIEALEALEKYKPEVVIASWITTYAQNPTYYPSSPYGIKEEDILEKIKTFIIIGNNDIHNAKPICCIPHIEVRRPWIISRATNPKNNRIYIWNK